MLKKKKKKIERIFLFERQIRIQSNSLMDMPDYRFIR